MNRAQAATGLALVLVAVVSGLWWGGRKPQTLPEQSGQSTSTAATWAEGVPTVDPSITVHVAGYVTMPGLVELPQGSRVADAVAAAGGLLPGAAVESINLAALVTDGQQVVVPGPGEPSGPGGSTNSDDPADVIVHLNTATVAELDALPGVGPVIAERIVAFRDENGPFQSVDDLLDVPGIGEAKLADLRDRVQVP